MKYAIVGWPAKGNSAFSGIVRRLCRGLVDLENDVRVFYSEKENQSKPGKPFQYRFQQFSAFDVPVTGSAYDLDAAINSFRPDNTLFVGSDMQVNTAKQLTSTLANSNYLFWYFSESYKPLPYEKDFVKANGDRIVFPSEESGFRYGDLWRKSITIRPAVSDAFFEDYGPFKDIQEKVFSGLSRKVPDGPVLLYAQRNTRRKNWPYVFELLSKLPECSLIAHTTPVDLRAYNLLELAEFYGVDSQVYFTQFSWAKDIDSSYVAELYKASHVVLNLSGCEGYGMTYEEAAASKSLLLQNDNASRGCKDFNVTIEHQMLLPDPSGFVMAVPNLDKIASAISKMEVQTPKLKLGDVQKTQACAIQFIEAFQSLKFQMKMDVEGSEASYSSVASYCFGKTQDVYVATNKLDLLLETALLNRGVNYKKVDDLATEIDGEQAIIIVDDPDELSSVSELKNCIWIYLHKGRVHHPDDYPRVDGVKRFPHFENVEKVFRQIAHVYMHESYDQSAPPVAEITTVV